MLISQKMKQLHGFVKENLQKHFQIQKVQINRFVDRLKKYQAIIFIPSTTSLDKIRHNVIHTQSKSSRLNFRNHLFRINVFKLISKASKSSIKLSSNFFVIDEKTHTITTFFVDLEPL